MKNQCCNILRWNVTILTMRIDTKIHSQSTLVEICFHISCLRKPYLQEQSFPANLACRYGACGPFVDLRSKQECNYKYDDWIHENRLRLCTKITGMLLEKRSDSVYKYGHVVLRALSSSCALKRSHNMILKAVEVTDNESTDPNKAKFKVKLIIWLAVLPKRLHNIFTVFLCRLNLDSSFRSLIALFFIYFSGLESRVCLSKACKRTWCVMRHVYELR